MRGYIRSSVGTFVCNAFAFIDRVSGLARCVLASQKEGQSVRPSLNDTFVKKKNKEMILASNFSSAPPNVPFLSGASENLSWSVICRKKKWRWQQRRQQSASGRDKGGTLPLGFQDQPCCISTGYANVYSHVRFPLMKE